MDTDIHNEEAVESTGIVDRVRTVVVRRPDDRVILGLAGGIADRLGIPDAYVRAAFVALSLAGGAGALLYLIGTAIAAEADQEPNDPPQARQVLALILMFLGVMLFFRGIRLWFGDSIVWSGTLLAFGGAAMWDRTSLFDSSDPSGLAPSRTRIVAGALLLLAGLASFSSSISTIESLGPAVTAAALTAAGFMIIFGPWVTSLVRDLNQERRAASCAPSGRGCGA